MNKYYLCCIVLLSCIWNVHNLLNKRGILYFNNELFNNEVNIMNINVSVFILQGDDDDEVKNDYVIYNSIKEKTHTKKNITNWDEYINILENPQSYSNIKIFNQKFNTQWFEYQFFLFLKTRF